MNLLEIKALEFAHSENDKYNFDFNLPAGKILALSGSSGSGKSTLLDLIAGFLRPHSGRIIVGGKDVTFAHPSKRQVSILFQKNNLFEHLTVLQNICLGLNPLTRATSEQINMASAMLEKIDLAEFGERPTHTLSGGQMQRVALAREMLRQSKIFLLDEPFNGLDDDSQTSMLPLLQQAVTQKDRSIIIVTHDMQSIADIIDMKGEIKAGSFHWR